MSRPRTRFELCQSRRIRRIALVFCSFVAVLGLLSFNPSCVEATCGDYLTHGQDHSGLNTLNNLFESVQVDNRLPGKNSDRRPCHGPSCQQGPLEHPFSTPVVSVEFQDRWWWTSNSAVQSPETASFLAPLSEPMVLPMVAYRLDRPPKI